MSEKRAPYIPDDLKADYECSNTQREFVYNGYYVGRIIERVGRAEDRNAALELEIRHLMWSSHGHQMRYGDDGEMQCGECAPFGVVDYKRDPIEKVREAFMWAKFARAATTTPAEVTR